MKVKSALGVATALAAGLIVAAVPAHAVSINISSATVAPGATAQIRVTLDAAGEQIGATMNDITFGPTASLTSCQIDPSLGGPLSTVRFQPQGCTPGVNCERARALILRSTGQPIPDGSVLYTCDVKVADNAAASKFPLSCTKASASTTAGKAVGVECASAAVQVASGAGSSAGGSSSAAGGGCAIGGGTARAGAATGLLLLPLVLLLRRESARRV